MTINNRFRHNTFLTIRRPNVRPHVLTRQRQAINTIQKGSRLRTATFFLHTRILLLVAQFNTTSIQRSPSLRRIRAPHHQIIMLTINRTTTNTRRLRITKTSRQANTRHILIFRHTFRRVERGLRIPIQILTGAFTNHRTIVISRRRVKGALLFHITVINRKGNIRQLRPAIVNHTPVQDFTGNRRGRVSYRSIGSSR